jgi:DNA-binding CsgD family transcriptional regulator
MAGQMTDTAAAAGTRYVGRHRELAVLDAALDNALTGEGRIVVVSGEAGIGKSRLLSEVERRAKSRGIAAVWGRCLETDGAPPYWPWRQVLRGVDAVRHRSRSRTTDPFTLAFRIAQDFDVVPDSTESPAYAELQGSERFQVFDAISGLLRSTAEAAGLVLLLDDLHWADAPSLRLLEHLGFGWYGSRALLVASHRPIGADRDAPLRQTVAQLSRVEGTVRLALEGFTPDETAARLSDVTGRRFPDAAVWSLQSRTRGNPFFISEFAHLLAGDGRELDAERDLPQSVRDVVARRISQLSAAAQEVLEVAAVAGAQPPPALVAATLGVPLADVLTSFDEAADEGLLTRAPDRLDYSFAHALVRDALYGELAATQRVHWHARIATELERTRAGEEPSALSRLAYHWLQAAPAGNAEHAASIAAAAAEAAIAQLAYEEAARLYEAAATADAQADSTHRVQLLLRAARSRFLAGELEQAVARCDEVAQLARTVGDAQMLADAAMVAEGVGDPNVSPVIAALCEEALGSLPRHALNTRSRLLAQLSTAKMYVGDFAPLESLSREALDIAEQTGDHDTLVAALRARHTARSDAAGIEERIVVAERLLELGQSARNRVDEFWARLWRFDIALQQGRLDDAEAEVGAVAMLVDRLRLPLASWHLERIRFAVAQSRGDFAAARRAAEAGDRYARSAGQLARFRLPMQEVIIAYLTGDDIAAAEAGLSQLDSAVPDLARMPTWIVLHRLTRCLVALSRDQVEDARRIFEGTPGPSSWAVMPPAALIATAHRGVVAAELGRRQENALLYQLLLPHTDLFATAGAGAVASFGSIERVLGVLARSLGRLDTAVRHLERAVEREGDAGMHPWLALSRYELARTLGERGRSGDVPRALALATQSREAADTLGMRPVSGHASALHDALRLRTRQSRVLTPRETEIARMGAEGLTSREIAEAMHISSRTADNHVQHILDKLELRSRSQIAAWVSRSASS